MMMKKYLWLLAVICAATLTGCAQQEKGASPPDYDQTKKMVVDILKTDEGKKAIQEVMNDEKMKQQLVMEQDIVKKTIEETLTSDKGKVFWKKAFEDPKFAQNFAKSMQEEHKKLLKALMKDPEYQAMVIEILQNPEVKKMMQTEMKNKDFRAHLQKVITETFNSPLFKAKIEDLLLKAAENMQGGKKKEDGSSQGESSSDEQTT